MTASETAFLFPGQGSYQAEAFAVARRRYPVVQALLADIDAVSEEVYGTSLSGILFTGRGPDLTQLSTAHEPWVAQLAIYAISMAAHRVLVDQGVRPDVITGHSLGEITALVAAGAYTIADGARLVVERVRVIEELGVSDGKMVALAVPEDRARRLIEVVDAEQLSVAALNHRGQTVCSGPSRDVVRLLGVARLLDITATELISPYAFHSPVLAPAVPVLAARIAKLPRHPLTVPVYSAMGRGYYSDDQDLPNEIAAQLVRPVHFAEALDVLYQRGVRRMVEVGAQTTLSRLAHKALSDADGLRTFATLDLDRPEHLALEDTLTALRAPDVDTEALRAAFAPELTAGEFAEFWASSGPAVVSAARARLAEFAGQPATPASAGPPEGNGASGGDRGAAPDRQDIEVELRTLYADALEYPEEVFTSDVKLEAELGVDSVKQVELLRRSFDRFGLPVRDEAFRVSDYDTLNKISGLIHESMHARS
jgi:acyl transferase domain-containing protein/acyl carrier protein